MEHLAYFSSAQKQRGDTAVSVDDNAFAFKLATMFYAHAEDYSDLTPALERLRAVFEPIELERSFMIEERGIVEREYEMRRQEDPLGFAAEDMLQKLYGPKHIARSVIGDRDAIRALTPEDALRAHSEFYHPANASLFIIGDINYSLVAQKLHETFPTKEDAPPAYEREAFQISQDEYFDEAARDDIFRDRVLFRKLVRFPKAYDWAQRMILRDHVHEILSSSYPSGLRKALQFDDFWAADLEFELEFITSELLLLTINAAPDFGVELDELSAKIQSQLSAFAEQGVSRQSFYDLKNDTEFYYEDLKNTPTDLREYVFRSLRLGVPPVSGRELDRAGRNLTHLDYDKVISAIATPSDTAIRFLRATQ